MIQIAPLEPAEIVYETDGEGDPLVLIMGIGYGRWAWRWLLTHLNQRFLTIAFDNRCAGASGCPDQDFTVAEMADDVAGLLDHLGVGAAHVFGVSMGGFIAQELALRHPGCVRRLVLGHTHLGLSKMVPLSEETLRILSDRSGTDEEQIRRGMPWAFRPGWVEEHPDEFEHIVGLRLPEQPTPERYQKQLAAALTHDVGEKAAEIAAPTLVLHGTEDRVVPSGNAQLIVETIPGAKLEMIEGVGHLFFIEEPERTARLITDFCTG